MATWHFADMQANMDKENRVARDGDFPRAQEMQKERCQAELPLFTYFLSLIRIRDFSCARAGHW